jgi:hypothetical protein
MGAVAAILLSVELNAIFRAHPKFGKQAIFTVAATGVTNFPVESNCLTSKQAKLPSFLPSFLPSVTACLPVCLLLLPASR